MQRKKLLFAALTVIAASAVAIPFTVRTRNLRSDPMRLEAV
jgi:hypothetical protein